MGQTALWTVMFFFASPAASSAYLTVSEIFPLEMRALAIAIFYSAGTAVGGIVAPWFFGRLIDTGSRDELWLGYVVAAALMLLAADRRGGIRHRRGGSGPRKNRRAALQRDGLSDELDSFEAHRFQRLSELRAPTRQGNAEGP